MKQKTIVESTARGVAYGAGLIAGAYAAYASVAWLRYGHPSPPDRDDHDPLLDRFIPICDVVERHHRTIAAPAEVTFAAACDVDLQQSPIVRAIFKGREWLMRSAPDPVARPRGLVAFTRSMGWSVLAEVPGREIVIGSVTRPWDANPTFRAIPPERFADFNEPDYVKIVWTLRADPIGAGTSVFRHETRAVATDPAARRKFRAYWSFLSAGIVLIRRVMLGLLQHEAERRAAQFGASPP